MSEQAELMRLAQELQDSKTKVSVQKREITSLNARVAESEQILHIGDTVRISSRYKYYDDWTIDGMGVVCTVTGLRLIDGGCDVTVKPKGETTEYDGFALADLIKEVKG